MRKRNEENFAARRAAILEAAARCFLERGFHQTSMQEICAEAKMSPGALYRYFSSKTDIIAAIAENEADANARGVEYLKRSENAALALMAIGDFVLDSMSDGIAGRLGVEIYAEAAHNDEVAAIFGTNYRAMRDGIAGAIRRDQKGGLTPGDVDPDRFAEIYLAILAGFSTRKIVDPDFDAKALKPMLRATIAALLAPRAERAAREPARAPRRRAAS